MRLLIHRLGPGLGDVLRCMPALDAARRRWPRAEITFATADQYAPLFADCPHVDRVIAPAGRLGRRARPSLANTYDVLIDLLAPAAEIERRLIGRLRTRAAQGRMLSRQEIFCQLVGAQPRDWIGRYSVTPPERTWADAYLHRAVNCGASFPQARPPGGRESATTPSPLWGEGGMRGRIAHPHPTLSLEGRGVAAPIVAVQRHAANPLRDWPWVDRLAERLRRVGCRAVILDREMGITVRQLAALIAACDLLVAPDSGPLHLAAPVGTPCLGLFGPTAPEVICKHYPQHRWLTGIGRPGACDRPCHGQPRPFCRRGAAPPPCLAALGVNEALAAACRLLPLPAHQKAEKSP